MYKELYRQKNTVVTDAYDRLSVAIHLKNKQFGYKTFMICGSEPGTGATTTAIELAISMANAGWKTVLVDCDMRKEGAFKRLSDSDEAGLYDYLLGEISEKELISRTNQENLDYISNGKSDGDQVSLLCSANLQGLLKNLKRDYDYVILDVPAFTSSVDCNILAVQVDAVVLVAAQYYSSQGTIEKARKKFESDGANVLGIVVNKLDEKTYKKVISNYDYFLKKKYKASAKRGNGGKH